MHYVKNASDHKDEPHTMASEMAMHEDSLLESLKAHCAGATELVGIDLGRVQITSQRGAAGAGVFSLEDEQIAIVPPISANEDDEQDIFACVRLLCRHAQSVPASLSGNLRIVVKPPHSWDAEADELPFHLSVDLFLDLHAPAIFELAVGRTDVAEALRAVSNFASPAPQPPAPLHTDVSIPFFYSALQPAPRLASDALQDAMQHTALKPILLPFQRRSVAWMLQREGKTANSDGNVVALPPTSDVLPTFWRRIAAAGPDGEHLDWYYNRHTATVTADRPESASGGLLAEEPGLGKTLECIALILLNPGFGRNPNNRRWDPEAKVEVRELKTTLIVTPSSLSQQWIDELSAHSPTLKVFVYEGWTKPPVPAKKRVSKGRSKKGKGKPVDDDDQDQDEMDVDNGGPLDWCSYINAYDVCITTYNVLQQDLNVARAPPTRPRREVAEYSRTRRPRSPLIMCEWYRVIMDEVRFSIQFTLEEMVSLIPRLSSFAVSGTPARAQVSDLSHVLKFIRVDPILESGCTWDRLQTRQFATDFVALFQHYAIRTTKAAVKEELTIPQQSRYLFPISMGPVEQHVYDQNLEKALHELGLDARGVAASENHVIDTGLLRTWLRKLRQICTHPQIGHLSLNANKVSKFANKPGGLKTMGEVLDGMKDQNWRNLMDDRRAKVNELATVGQLMQHDKSIDARHHKALDHLLQAEKEADQLIEDIQEAIAEHDAKGEELKKDAAALRIARGQAPIRKPNAQELEDKGKGKARERDISPTDSDDGFEDNDLPKTPAGEEHVNKKRALQQRLREALLTLHKVKFLEGDVFHTLGEMKAAEEERAYAAAEELRRKLLKFTEQSAKRAMSQLVRDAGRSGFTEQELLIKTPSCPDGGGIRSKHLVEEADTIIIVVINEQTKLLWKWRQHIHGLLTQPLSASDSEADGQEYTRTLETQGEAETYLQVYAMLLADRREALLAERTALAVYDARERKLRKTKAAMKATAVADDDQVDLKLLDEDIELQPEHEVLKKELAEARKAIVVKLKGRAVKSVMVELTGVAAKISNIKDPEKVIAQAGAMSLRQIMTQQGAVNDQLDADVGLFRKAFNERILYFRQLQEISDSVVQPEWESDVSIAIAENNAVRTELDSKINTGRARLRYARFPPRFEAVGLNHIASNQGLDDDDEEEGCILCKCDFTRGYITQCAHVFCEDCMKAWLSRHHKACPVCRVSINVDTLQRFSVEDKNPDSEQPMPPKLDDGAVPRSRRRIEYNIIRPDLVEEINSMESHGSYGSKIQTLVRHLLYLQLSDPGAKSIVFSAWADSLHNVLTACATNASGGRHAAKKFRTDPDILVLLLHGERENAGLNITCASRVFLLESVVHHSFEIQAIARIDRLGQSKPTEVYCYYAEDTVERNILDLATRQGLSLYTKETSHGTLNTSAFAPESEKGVVDSPSKKKQKGDFIYKLDDMMSILFPHLTEDVEYLLPVSEMATESDAAVESAAPTPVRARALDFVTGNAVAGPSRLA
ncbi:hypothetical protein FA95DRAFT_1579571 [Auriscalpium vulgare]|uniref:Uncharacterized protein n=1 Tax=Auriscalpium vulgare TaxID=40419 RepID=A0ACB8SC34_9AGAM|nr:hypothetical protein FA95DRAFT_1579571 [Auriscalpium vulgare]